MIVQVIRNEYDNVLKQEDISLAVMLTHPLNMPKKKLPQWQFIQLIEGAPKVRNQDYYATRHALVLDIDKNMSIAEFEDRYSHLAYALYTTSNHRVEGDRYRVILPLDVEYPNELFKFESVRYALQSYFPGFDPSSLSNFHKLPVLPPNPSDYYYAFNKGRKFSFNDIEYKVKEYELDEEFNRQFELSLNPPRVVDPLDERRMSIEYYIDKWVIGRLDEVNWNESGARDNTITSHIRTWKIACEKNGFDPRDIVRACEQYRLPEEFLKKVRKRLR